MVISSYARCSPVNSQTGPSRIEEDGQGGFFHSPYSICIISRRVYVQESIQSASSFHDLVFCGGGLASESPFGRHIDSSSRAWTGRVQYLPPRRRNKHLDPYRGQTGQRLWFITKCLYDADAAPRDGEKRADVLAVETVNPVVLYDRHRSFS